MTQEAPASEQPLTIQTGEWYFLAEVLPKESLQSLQVQGSLGMYADLLSKLEPLVQEQPDSMNRRRSLRHILQIDDLQQSLLGNVSEPVRAKVFPPGNLTVSVRPATYLNPDEGSDGIRADNYFAMLKHSDSTFFLTHGREAVYLEGEVVAHAMLAEVQFLHSSILYSLKATSDTGLMVTSPFSYSRVFVSPPQSIETGSPAKQTRFTKFYSMHADDAEGIRKVLKGEEYPAYDPIAIATPMNSGYLDTLEIMLVPTDKLHELNTPVVLGKSQSSAIWPMVGLRGLLNEAIIESSLMRQSVGSELTSVLYQIMEQKRIN